MATDSRPLSHPTEDAPEEGSVTQHGVLLARAERWIEDDLHVIRSTEFPILAEGDTLEQAASVFGQKVEELAVLLAGLIREGEAAQNEIEQATRLFPRVVAVKEELERAEKDRLRHLRLALLPRRHGHAAEGWMPSSRPSSSPPSLVS